MEQTDREGDRQTDRKADTYLGRQTEEWGEQMDGEREKKKGEERHRK